MPLGALRSRSARPQKFEGKQTRTIVLSASNTNSQRVVWWWRSHPSGPNKRSTMARMAAAAVRAGEAPARSNWAWAAASHPWRLAMRRRAGSTRPAGCVGCSAAARGRPRRRSGAWTHGPTWRLGWVHCTVRHNSQWLVSTAGQPVAECIHRGWQSRFMRASHHGVPRVVLTYSARYVRK